MAHSPVSCNAKEQSLKKLKSCSLSRDRARSTRNPNKVYAVVELDTCPTGMRGQEEVIAEAVSCLDNVLRLNEDRSWDRIEEENKLEEDSDVRIGGGFRFCTDTLNHVDIGDVEYMKGKKVGDAFVERGEYDRERGRFEKEGEYPVYEVGDKEIIVLD